MGILITTARMLGFVHEESKESKKTRPSRVLVFRTEESNGVKDPRYKRIIELANGQSVGEITEFIYYEQLRRGAWLADIGLWKDMICYDLEKSIGQLAAMGFLRLELNDRGSGPTSPELLVPDDLVPDAIDQPQTGSPDKEERILGQAIEAGSEI